jgi:hypothetical protein
MLLPVFAELRSLSHAQATYGGERRDCYRGTWSASWQIASLRPIQIEWDACHAEPGQWIGRPILEIIGSSAVTIDAVTTE